MLEALLNSSKKMQVIFSANSKLEKAGFLISEKQGNTKVYYTNKHFLIFKELQSIVLKSQRAAQKRQQSSQ
jgi:hypothetical protein